MANREARLIGFCFGTVFFLKKGNCTWIGKDQCLVVCLSEVLKLECPAPFKLQVHQGSWQSLGQCALWYCSNWMNTAPSSEGLKRAAWWDHRSRWYRRRTPWLSQVPKSTVHLQDTFNWTQKKKEVKDSFLLYLRPMGGQHWEKPNSPFWCGSYEMDQGRWWKDCWKFVDPERGEGFHRARGKRFRCRRWNTVCLQLPFCSAVVLQNETSLVFLTFMAPPFFFLSGNRCFEQFW